MESRQKFYLGFDFSTQQAKVIVVDNNLTVVYEDHISYDADLPEFRTKGGVNIHDDKVSVTVHSAMFVKALDMVLDRMLEAGFEFGNIVAIAGASQQAGAVFLKHGARQLLNNLKPEKSLYDQLKDVFSVPEPPMWMDESSEKQCQQLEQALGGPMGLASLTGSRAFCFSTGSQIMKCFQDNRDAYDNTEKISMISSFLASLFVGDYAPIDYGDGSIMNLMDIKEKQWSPKCLEACGPMLANKLGEPVPSWTLLGNVSSYLVQKYKFSADCKVTASTGDGIQSSVGLGARMNELIITLGTADSMLFWSATPQFNLYTFWCACSIDANSFVAQGGSKNGSLVRQHAMVKYAGSWEKFSELFYSTPPGNNGNIGIYFENMEIIPRAIGTFRFNKNNEMVESFPPEVEVRAVLEGQFLAKRMYAERCGYRLGPNSSVIATGGASANTTILQVIADIFNTPVYTIDVPNSVALGGCYRAILAREKISFDKLTKSLPAKSCAATPTPGLEQVYADMLLRYEQLEEQITTESHEKQFLHD